MDTIRRPEEILEKIGGCGRFQITLSIITHCVKTPAVMTILLMVFSVATPEWWCADKSDILDSLNATSVNIYSSTSNESLNSAQSFQDETPNPLFNSNSSLAEMYNAFKSCKNYNGTTCSSLQYSEQMKTIVSEVIICYLWFWNLFFFRNRKLLLLDMFYESLDSYSSDLY